MDSVITWLRLCVQAWGRLLFLAPWRHHIDAMPTIDLTDEEHAAVTAAVRRSIADDKVPAVATASAAEIRAGEARSRVGAEADTRTAATARGALAEPWRKENSQMNTVSGSPWRGLQWVVLVVLCALAVGYFVWG
jgi:hypothetical protein